MTHNALDCIDALVFSPKRAELLAPATHGGLPGYSVGEILRLELDSGDVRNLTAHPADGAEPSWSPDGKWIAFTSNRTGNGDIYVMARNGQHVRRVTSGPARDSHPAWSPDGKSLALRRRSDRTDEDAIVLASANGAGADTLARFRPRDNLNAASWRVAWLPSGRRVATDIGMRITIVDTESRRMRTLRGLATGLRVSPRRDEFLITPHRRIEPQCHYCPPYSDESLSVVSVNGTRRRLARAYSIDESWSPNGRFVALVLVTGQTSDDR